jgi:hypothetical protein
MSKDPSPVVAGPRNAGDVVAGPVGAASLREPSPSGPAGVDLEALAAIDAKLDRDPPTKPSLDPDAVSRPGRT